MRGAPEWNMKTCLGCGERKPFHEFSPNKGGHGSKDGRHSHCKLCRATSRKLNEHESETKGIVKPAVDLLNQMPGVLAVRLNSGVAMRGGRHIKLAPEGTADILAIAKGQAFFFECKKPGEKLSPEQKKFSDRALRAGARFWMITEAGHAAKTILAFQNGTLDNEEIW